MLQRPAYGFINKFPGKLPVMLLLMSLAYPLKSQQVKIAFQTGIATFAMNEMQRLNDHIISSLAFDTRLTSDFPPYIYYRPMIMMKFNRSSLGVMYAFQSTGSRITGKDYSGEYRFDMKIKSKSPGVYLDLDVVSMKQAILSVYTIFGWFASYLEINEIFTIPGIIDVDYTYEYKSYNYSLEPGINFSYPVKFAGVALNAGYLIQMGKQAFYADKNMDNIIYDAKTRQPVKPGWSGLRIGLSVYCTFGRKK
jgi:hypothetical protein